MNKEKWALKDRLRSPVAWAAIAGCIATIFSVFGVWSKIGIDIKGFDEIVASIGTVLTAFGVFNDPTNRNAF